MSIQNQLFCSHVLRVLLAVLVTGCFGCGKKDRAMGPGLPPDVAAVGIGEAAPNCALGVPLAPGDTADILGIVQSEQFQSSVKFQVLLEGAPWRTVQRPVLGPSGYPCPSPITCTVPNPQGISLDTWTPPDTGTYHWTLIADADSLIAESNETNNRIERIIVVESSDIGVGFLPFAPTIDGWPADTVLVGNPVRVEARPHGRGPIRFRLWATTGGSVLFDTTYASVWGPRCTNGHRFPAIGAQWIPSAPGEHEFELRMQVLEGSDRDGSNNFSSTRVIAR